ncbi:MAG: ABC transporter ATP-binding protein [Paludibacter sp.]|nr:ABC transporter ATP-binding protein [Paludibacter sp.]
MSIVISNLSKCYGSQTVLSDINFTVGEGEIAGFLGPNGAGKSTTMKILTGVLPYNAGSAKVCGLEVRNNLLEIKKIIGYLPEHNPLYTEMYVKEYLTFVAEIYDFGRTKHARVDEMIALVGLQPEYRKKIGQLSKGYRQRVGLAQALLPNPKVLILDEPTTGLDPNQIIEIRSLIRQLGQDRTVLLSTHILHEIKEICNRVLIINKGKIAADYRDMAEISLNAENRFEVEFSEKIDENLLEKLDGVSSLQTSDGKIFTILATEDLRNSLFDFAVRNNIKLLSLNKLENTIEEIFRELTK